MKYAQKIKNVTLILVGLTSFITFVNVNLSYAFEFISLPGAPEFSEEIKSEIQNEWEHRPSNYVARTRHLNEDGTPLYANRLIVEPSPYLRQHAHNPVNWYPWGEDAFRSARELDRPILLSIGYSACHWCHVMEEESYDHELIAKFLNENFISIKVDRESRPEVDELYLLAVQIMGGSGGWPLNVLLTSDGRPFWGATYLPPDELATVLRAMKDAWVDQGQRTEIANVAHQVHSIIDGFAQGEKTDIEVGREQVETVVSELVEIEKSKDEFTLPTASFPSESELFLLLDEAWRQPDSEALYAAESRLLAMAKGGIRDHVGGGFHRYTVDSEWLVPHFEKMLYNQALLGRAYLYAYEITAKDIYRRVAEELFTYVLRDMRSDEGLFFSATDADSEGEEGVFFLWTPQEVDAAVTDNAEFVLRHFGVTENGNFEGRNILFLEKTPEQVALEVGASLEDYLTQLEQTREQLRLYRDQREKPFLDEKVIAAWNGLMITSLAEASRILENKGYLNAAISAAESFWSRFVQDNGEIYRVLFADQLSQAGKLKDYAFMSQALLSLYDETADRTWLSRSESLTEKMVELFWDDERWGFYSVADNDLEGLISRQKDRFDEALPAGNSVAMKVLSMLYDRTGKRVYSQRVDQTVQAFASEIYSYPSSFSYALSAISEHRGGPAGVREYAAAGHVRVRVSTPQESVNHLKVVVEIQLDEGWHIQSNKPLSENLIATRIESDSSEWSLAGIEFPEEEFITTKFQSEPLSVWSGNVTVPIEINHNGEKKVYPVLNVRLQACDDQSCLLPETVQLEIPINSITS